MRRFTLSTMVFSLVTAATIFLSASPASACSCVGFTDEEAFELADAVFVGSVSQIYDARSGSSKNPEVAVLQVSDVYKGEVREVQAVTTPSFGPSCGFGFEVDGIYVVFGRVEGINDVDEGFYEANLCTGTRLLDNRAPEVSATPAPAQDGDPPTVAAIQAQLGLGEVRESLIPEAIIFVSVLTLILGMAAWFSRKSRPPI